MNKIIAIYQKFPISIKIRSLYFVILTLIATFLEVISITMIMPVISLMLDTNAYQDIFFLKYLSNLYTTLDINFSLPNLIITFSVIFILKIIYNVYFTFFQEDYGLRVYEFMSNTMLKIYMLKDWNFFLNTNSAYLIRNIISESGGLRATVFVPLLQIFSETIILLGIISLLIFVNAKVTILIVTFLIIFGILYKLITKNFFINLGREKTYQSGLLYKLIPKIFALIREIKILKKEIAFFKYFTDANSKYAKSNKLFSVTHIVPRSIIETLLIIFILISVILTDESDNNYAKIFPLLGLYLGAAYKVLPSFVKIINALRSFDFSNQPLIIFEKEFNSKDITKNFISTKLLDEKMPFKSSIEFRNLSFKYENRSKDVFKNFNYKINKNAILGIKGKSGRGKSTFANLLAGLIMPNSGEILVDGKDIQKNMNSWQKNIGLVQQDSVLVDDTIKNNISLSFFDEKIDEEKLTNSVKNSNLLEFTNTLKNGLNTIIGERGIQISGGQRQRICIARMLYFNPEVIILDEATSALDEKNEKEILEFVKKLKGKKTIILISHRAETLSYSDTILEM
jgi:ATP-binding cassette, subfamily B, bacterial PglK